MRIRVHWLFVALLLLASLGGYYVEAMILLGSLAAHEIAHLAVAWVLDIGVEELLLTPFGAMARMDSALSTDPQAETTVALAGPFQSFFLAGLAQMLTGGEMWDQRLVRFCFEANASLAFFNLIPALPLDGGRAMRGLLAQRWGFRRVTRWMALLGRFCGLLMTGTALLVLINTGRPLATPLVGGLFLFLTAGQEEEAAIFRSYRQFLRKGERLAHRRVVGAHQVVAMAGTRLGELLEHLASRHYHLVLVVNRELQPLGTLYEAELMAAFRELGPEVRVEEIFDR